MYYFRKLNIHIVTARQINADYSLGKVVSNYPLPTIDNLLVKCNGCKFFSTIYLRSGYYHIGITKEATEKTAFITDKGKWLFHSLLFGTNIGPLAFTYVLGKILVPCTEFTINHLNEMTSQSSWAYWEEHLEHLKAVFKQCEAAKLKIKCNKYEFLKTKEHYLGFLVGINGVQPLPENIAATQAIQWPKAVDELRPYLDLVGFYTKFIPFFADITISRNRMQRKTC